MRIAFVGTGQEILRPRAGHSLAVQTIGLAQALRDRHEVHVITRTDRAHGLLRWKLTGEAQLIDGVHFHFVPSDVEQRGDRAAPPDGSAFGRKFAARAARELHALEPDAVLIWEALALVLPIRTAVKRAMIVVDDAHGGLRRATGAQASELAGNVDRVLVPARFLERAIAARHPALHAKLAFLPFGVDTDLFRVLVPKGRLAKRFDLIRGESTMLTFIGRLTPEKGAHVLLERYQDCQRRIARQPHLFLIGPPVLDPVADGDPFAAEKQGYLARLEQGARAQGEFVHLLARELPPPTIAGHLEASDVLVLPALADQTTGAVVAEAMASGMAVVAYDGGIHSELLERSTDIGTLVPRGNTAALLDAVASVVETPPDVRFERGKRAREIATTELTFATVARTLEALLAH